MNLSKPRKVFLFVVASLLTLCAVSDLFVTVEIFKQLEVTKVFALLTYIWKHLVYYVTLTVVVKFLAEELSE